MAGDSKKERAREYARQWRADNREAVSRHNATYRKTASGQQKQREWRLKNPELDRAAILRWKANNPGSIAKYNIAYKSCTKKQTPAWADLNAINEIYLQAQCAGLTVDHIVPLRGETVCGLHVENNMRLITHEENASKGNALIEELA